MAVRDASELRDETRQALNAYLHEAGRKLGLTDPAVVDEALEDIETHFLEQLDADSDAEDVVRVAGEIGEVERPSLGARSAPARPAERRDTRAAGDILGVPYDARVPTGERAASRLWDPRNPHLFVPRLFGIGWDLNFGAVAVRLGLIEPDAEDEPFAAVPDLTFLVALMVPVALSAAILGSYLALREVLPAELPVHWDISGQADRFSAAQTAFLFLFALAGVPTTWSASIVARGRSKLARGGSIGLASFLSALAATIWAYTLADAFELGAPGWLLPASILIALLVPLAVLTGLARAGRAAEVRRDLDPSSEESLR